MFTEPVGPSIEIELLPPYWVVLAPRKKVPTGHVGAEARRLARIEPAELLQPCDALARVFAEADGVGHGALDQHRVAVVGRVVVVAGVEVVAGEGLHDAVVVGVLRGRLGEGRVVEAAVGALDHLGAVVGRVEDPQREVLPSETNVSQMRIGMIWQCGQTPIAPCAVVALLGRVVARGRCRGCAAAK